MWTYSQRTGLLALDGVVRARGYSGHGDGLNNPAMQNVHNVGPIPRGKYTIGEPFAHPEKGPLVMRLTPAAGTEEFGRAGLLIHGDNQALNRTASEGCIILSRAYRQDIVNSKNHDLEVIG